MLGIPASVAGVPDLALSSPGRALAPAMLVAARLADVGRLYRMGGAQAVAALAYGTETVERVDKIVGPGNAYVQEAKRQVFGEVAIDSEAGPSEVFIVAEPDSSPTLLAADLLAQAEHDAMSSSVLATPSEALAAATLAELASQLSDLPTAEIARKALEWGGAVIVTRDLEEALELANRYAPEHLQLFVREPDRWLDRVENAGAVFLGPYSPVPLGGLRRRSQPRASDRRDRAFLLRPGRGGLPEAHEPDRVLGAGVPAARSGRRASGPG